MSEAPPDLKGWWLSTDLATSSGAVIWYNDEPRWLARIWPNTTKSKWWLQVWPVTKTRRGLKANLGEKTTHADDDDVWGRLWSLAMQPYQAFITEAVYGPGADFLAERRGTVLVYLGCRPARTPVLKVRPHEWRSVATMDREDPTWPAGRDAKKAYAIHLVKEELGIELPDDVADAYLIGKWYVRREEYRVRNENQAVQRPRRAREPDLGTRRVRKGRRRVRQS